MWEAPVRSSVYLPRVCCYLWLFAPPAKLANAETPSSVVAHKRAAPPLFAMPDYHTSRSGLQRTAAELAAGASVNARICPCPMHTSPVLCHRPCSDILGWRTVCARGTYMARRGMETPLLCERTALTLTHSSVSAGARAASPVSAPTPKAAAPTPQRRAAKSPARAQPKAILDDEGARADGAQKNSAKLQLERLQESHDALKQRCDALLLGLLVLTLLVVWSNYCTQTFFANAYGRDAFCIFMALCFILSAENKESITALSKPRRYFLIFFGFMLFFELFPHAFPVWACALILAGCCAAYVLL